MICLSTFGRAIDEDELGVDKSYAEDCLNKQFVSGTVPVIQVFQVPAIYTGLFPAKTIIDVSPCRVNIIYNINMNFGFCFFNVPLRTQVNNNACYNDTKFACN